MRRSAVVLIGLLLAASAAGQSLYKFRGPDGEWVYTDRKPPETQAVEVRELPADGPAGGVAVTRQTRNGRQTLLASNTLHAPVQLRLLGPDSDADNNGRDWLLDPDSSTELMSFEVGTPAARAGMQQRYMWLIGDPEAEHRPEQPYRAPFPAAVTHRISQAWPETLTHLTPDSVHAVDIAMPVGSNVHAARDGTVVEVASTNYSSSDTPQGGEGSRANIVRVMHEDGTFAIYAHLNWNSIRVRPGQFVRRGEYIANSGNTGFSTGPHLHFVVVRNAGMRMVSLPVSFAQANGAMQTPKTGATLTAH